MSRDIKSAEAQVSLRGQMMGTDQALPAMLSTRYAGVLWAGKIHLALHRFEALSRHGTRHS